MRLWHYQLLPALPDSQLIAQWRELNSIFKKQDKHILINYIYEYPKENLLWYTELVIRVMDRRGIKIKSVDNLVNYFKDTKFVEMNNPFPKHHNQRYMLQCFYNLQEKYDRGQKDFMERRYKALLWQMEYGGYIRLSKEEKESEVKADE